MINDKFYKQISDVVMQTSLGPALASFESTWLKDCPGDIMTVG